MADFYKQKLVCMARCKNEIHIIKEWYESLPFVDVFVMTDNNSTDGTYEYLKSLPNVIVTRVEGFDEGRDFQILLKMAKALEPEWLLKIDCDEIFEDLAKKNFHKLLEQKKYNTIYFRKYNFHYLAGDKHYTGSPADKLIPEMYLTRNKKHINILDIKSHVGPFTLTTKPLLSNFRIKHYPKSSPEKCKEKYETYMAMKEENDKKQDYSRLIDESPEKIEKIEKNKKLFIENETNYSPKLNLYGINCLLVTNNKHELIKASLNKRLIRAKIKNLITAFLILTRLDQQVLKILKIKRKRI